MRLASLTAALAFGLLGLGVRSALGQEQLSSADFRLASLKLGSPLSEVHATLGEPDSTRRTEGPYGEALTSLFYPGLKVMTHPDGVYYIESVSRAYPARRGIAVGDAVERVRTLYGQPGRVDSGKLTYCAPQQDECLVFLRFMTEHDRIVEIVVAAPLD